MVALRRCIYYKQLFKAAEAWRILTQERMRSIIIPYVSRHCGLLNEISRVCGSSWYTPVTAVRSSAGPEIFIIVWVFLPISLLFPLRSITLTLITQPLCPLWWFLSLLFSAFLLSRKLQGAFGRNLMSHNSAAPFPCPLTLQCHFPIPFLHCLPSHSVDAQNPETPSGQQQDRKKGRNNVFQRVTQQVDFPASSSISPLLLPSTGVYSQPAIPSPPSYYKHSSPSFVSCPWGIASVWPAGLAPILHSLPRGWLFPHLSVPQQTPHPRLHSVSFVFHSSTLYLLKVSSFLNSHLCWFWRWSVGKKTEVSKCQRGLLCKGTEVNEATR